MRQRRVKMMTLYLMHSGMSSQSCISCVKPRSNFLKYTSLNAGCCILHSSHVAICWSWPLEPRRERHYSSPPLTLQKGGRLSPQTPRWAFCRICRSQRRPKAESMMGFGGRMATVKSAKCDLVWATIVESQQVCTKVILCLGLQFFTTLNKNPGQKAGSAYNGFDPWPDPTRTQIADPVTRWLVTQRPDSISGVAFSHTPAAGCKTTDTAGPVHRVVCPFTAQLSLVYIVVIKRCISRFHITVSRAVNRILLPMDD